MLESQSSRGSSQSAELLVMWASASGMQCVLAFLGGALELRLQLDGTVVRRAHFIDIRPAREAAQRWRVDWDIEARSRQPLAIRILCPECGDEAFGEQDASTGAQWFHCASCGDTWTFDS